jgi:hypothetical protein
VNALAEERASELLMPIGAKHYLKTGVFKDCLSFLYAYAAHKEESMLVSLISFFYEVMMFSTI